MDSTSTPAIASAESLRSTEMEIDNFEDDRSPNAPLEARDAPPQVATRTVSPPQPNSPNAAPSPSRSSSSLARRPTIYSAQSPAKRRRTSSSLQTAQQRVDEESIVASLAVAALQASDTPPQSSVAPSIASAAPSTTHQPPNSAEDAVCVVTHATEQMTTIEELYVVDVDTPPREVARLEWSWDMARSSLDPEMQQNIHPLSCELVRWYTHRTKHGEYRGWFWLPIDTSILSEMHESYVGTSPRWELPAELPNERRDPREFYANKEFFDYRFLASRGMQHCDSVRRNEAYPAHWTVELVTQHYYPFKTLAPVSLHVPYHFAIVDAGKKLYALYGDRPIQEETLQHDFPGWSLYEWASIASVRNIYVAWMKARPDRVWMGNAGAAIADDEPAEILASHVYVAPGPDADIAVR
ncbi:hypothetical protein BD626DRAFT_626544 [Schizophyllum amplum]|uniref:Uncharacterized protein n=1 Tax=Schizophyllum amplum TaxID=97359 RepID=A0A550CTV0_9AGAR|nr:hypothetical protein BD626DRAFT_626544 [Auriculariopsis ampla]